MTRKLTVKLMKWESVECLLKTPDAYGGATADVYVNGMPIQGCLGYTVDLPPRGLLTLTLSLEGEPEDLLTVVSTFGGLLEIK
ncbi:hypothetical protein Q0M94_28340 (plasmid) [Deinococcus radiomollis]|uniref:hypothetical protein n=1 Tax=Deinococcus radiomollis TaxID=468916 RepID=UPI0038923C7D